MDNDVLFAVNGTLMRGLELEDNLVRAGGRFVRGDQTQVPVPSACERD